MKRKSTEAKRSASDAPESAPEVKVARITARATIICAGLALVGSLVTATAVWFPSKDDKDRGPQRKRTTRAALPVHSAGPPAQLAQPASSSNQASFLGPTCRNTCQGDDCPRFQIATGADLGHLLAAAQNFRTRISPTYCAEIFYSPRSKAAPYVLTLGPIDEETGKQALVAIRVAKLWKGETWLMSRRARYGERIFPPTCDSATMGGTNCAQEPPPQAQFDGNVYRWNGKSGACSCRANNGRDGEWRAQGRCVAACAENHTKCETARMSGGVAAGAGDCAAENERCLAGCPVVGG